MRTLNAWMLGAALLAVPVGAVAEEAASYSNLLTPLLSQNVDVLGTPLAYPEGEAKVTAAIVTIPPGGETGWHSHEVPLFAHILEGELTVDYGEKGTRTFRAGDSVLEAVGWTHNGTNTGDIPMRLIAVYMGGGDAANTVTEPTP
ncbi:cupin domain-containing protein [Arsenicitalea aurantiaca]|uniref:Cupin domain-containing protein n=1 Tax=Arsenicitalea aurantiaca TaxID=1783274 RepID=A0A433XLG9_9HYPH|nr:cupin domain-containing protein [Arsenicitalea aurantiaca]RUT34920.1 cupin domain-containing protein [Arsenicitalea aurantiaca]